MKWITFLQNFTVRITSSISSLACAEAFDNRDDILLAISFLLAMSARLPVEKKRKKFENWK